MTALPLPVAVSAPPEPMRPSRVLPVLVACAAIDAFAAALLLVRAPAPPALAGLAAATLHTIAIVVLFVSTRARASRGWLGAAAALAVPGAGVGVAAVTMLTRGRERVCGQSRRKPRRAAPRAGDRLQRLGHALSPCDALDRGDEEQRRAALAALVRRADRDAIALLRRTTTAAEPELALAAALALDQLGERFERGVDQRGHERPRRAAG